MNEIDISKKYKTVDGREVRFLGKINDKKYPIIGVIINEDDERLTAWTTRGEVMAGCPTPHDLVPVKEKKYGWINIYPNTSASVQLVIFSSKEEADEYSSPSRVDCIYVEWEQ